jgi:hypothetical protein
MTIKVTLHLSQNVLYEFGDFPIFLNHAERLQLILFALK